MISKESFVSFLTDCKIAESSPKFHPFPLQVERPVTVSEVRRKKKSIDLNASHLFRENLKNWGKKIQTQFSATIQNWVMIHSFFEKLISRLSYCSGELMSPRSFRTLVYFSRPVSRPFRSSWTWSHKNSTGYLSHCGYHIVQVKYFAKKDTVRNECSFCVNFSNFKIFHSTYTYHIRRMWHICPNGFERLNLKWSRIHELATQ